MGFLPTQAGSPALLHGDRVTRLRYRALESQSRRCCHRRRGKDIANSRAAGAEAFQRSSGPGTVYCAEVLRVMFIHSVVQ